MSETDRTPFREYSQSVETLLTCGQQICKVSDPPVRPMDLPGWQGMEMRYKAYRDAGGEPRVMALLFGPTGSGKSTVFRQLTGLNVPAGDAEKPTSKSCVVAVPKAVQQNHLERLLCGFRLVRMTDPEQARQSLDTDQLFWAPYTISQQDGELPLLLADVTDFNSVEHTNWDKAEIMLARAEVVVFMVYNEGFADDRVVRTLARCCRKAAFLVYLFTKTSLDAAEKKWKHLLRLAQERSEGLGFSERRADGMTLHEFLRKSPAYCSPYWQSPDVPYLENVRPIDPGAPPFTSLLRGHDAAKLVLSGLVESTTEAIKSCRRVMDKISDRRPGPARTLGKVGWRGKWFCERIVS